jgi:hypothetical protein
VHSGGEQDDTVEGGCHDKEGTIWYIESGTAEKRSYCKVIDLTLKDRKGLRAADLS